MRRFLKRLAVGVSTLTELLGSVWRGPRWWLVPVILVLLPLAILLVILNAVPLVSPFVYVVF